MRAVSNLSTGGMRRSALLLVPVSLAVLALAGVTIRPMMQLRAAQADVDQALADQALVEHEAERHRAFVESRAQARLDAAIAEVRELIPTGVSELDVHTAVRVAAELHQIELTRLSVGALFDPGLQRDHEVVLLRPVELRGRGRVDELFASIATLEALGVPITVQELSVEAIPGDVRFDIDVTLGLYQREPIPGAREEFDPQGQGDMP